MVAESAFDRLGRRGRSSAKLVLPEPGNQNRSRAKNTTAQTALFDFGRILEKKESALPGGFGFLRRGKHCDLDRIPGLRIARTVLPLQMTSTHCTSLYLTGI